MVTNLDELYDVHACHLHEPITARSSLESNEYSQWSRRARVCLRVCVVDGVTLQRHENLHAARQLDRPLEQSGWSVSATARETCILLMSFHTALAAQMCKSCRFEFDWYVCKTFLKTTFFGLYSKYTTWIFMWNSYYCSIRVSFGVFVSYKVGYVHFRYTFLCAYCSVFFNAHDLYERCPFTYCNV